MRTELDLLSELCPFNIYRSKSSAAINQCNSTVFEDLTPIYAVWDVAPQCPDFKCIYPYHPGLILHLFFTSTFYPIQC